MENFFFSKLDLHKSGNTKNKAIKKIPNSALSVFLTNLLPQLTNLTRHIWGQNDRFKNHRERQQERREILSEPLFRKRCDVLIRESIQERGFVKIPNIKKCIISPYALLDNQEFRTQMKQKINFNSFPALGIARLSMSPMFVHVWEKHWFILEWACVQRGADSDFSRL